MSWYNVTLSYSALCISLVFAFVGWSVCRELAHLRKDVIDVIFLSGIMGVAIIFIGYSFGPTLALERYLGLSVFVVLAIPASIGLYTVYTCGRVGRAFASLVVITMILGMVFGGFYTPDYAPLGQPAWLSQRAPITYGEASCLEHLSLMTCNNAILIDWRAGVVFEYYCVKNSFYTRGALNITLIGSYGFFLSEKDAMTHLTHENAIFIYRKGALEALSLLIETDEGKLLKIVDAYWKVYDSGRIQVFASKAC